MLCQATLLSNSSSGVREHQGEKNLPGCRVEGRQQIKSSTPAPTNRALTRKKKKKARSANPAVAQHCVNHSFVEDTGVERAAQTQTTYRGCFARCRSLFKISSTSHTQMSQGLKPFLSAVPTRLYSYLLFPFSPPNPLSQRFSSLPLIFIILTPAATVTADLFV